MFDPLPTSLLEGEKRRAWLLTDGKIGDEIPCRGVANAMCIALERRTVCPRNLFAAIAPWGFVDPRDVRSVLQPPYPTIAFAAGRRAVPYLRRLKRVSPDTFTVFFGKPRAISHGADVIWAPAHDGLVGPHVIGTGTTPHVYSASVLAQAREEPDPRVAALPKPRASLLIGGRSRHHPFTASDRDAIIEAAKAVRAQGFSLGATASRRTPPALVTQFQGFFANDPNAFVWSGEGENPYPSLLALAEAVLVTADSTNMISEAVATGAPVHILPLNGGHPRLKTFVDRLVSAGAAREWAGTVERGRVEPLDVTPTVAAEIARRFALFRRARSRVAPGASAR